MDLLGAIHENLHGMNLKVLRVILALYALQLLQALLGVLLCVDHKAAVNINGQLSLPVQLTQTLIDLLVELHISRKPGIKHRGNSEFDCKIDPTLKRRVNLLIGQFHRAVENDANFSCAFVHISGYMSVFSYIKGKSRYGIRRVVCNAVLLKDL